MSLSESSEPSDTEETDSESTELSRDELAVRVELLEEELEQVRGEYARVRQTRYRRTAIGLLLVGLVALGGGLLFTDSRPVLFAIGATGVFAAVLTFYLTPEQFIAASVSERIYATLADNEAALADDLGLSDQRVYIPTDRPDDRTARLFVPQFREYELPSTDDLDSPFVVTDDEARRGLALRPTGEALFEEFERALGGPLDEDSETVAAHLADAIVEQFELAGRAIPDIGADDEVVVVGISESAYGRVDRFDHPTVSLLAVGLAQALDVPVSVDVEAGDDRNDYLVELRPQREADPSADESAPTEEPAG